jgi:chromosome partitioning protein
VVSIRRTNTAYSTTTSANRKSEIENRKLVLSKVEVSKMTKIYTFVNQKGGVGKTTTAINLGAFLAKFGQRVLIVDLDPQANATSCLGVDKSTVAGGTYEALLDLLPPDTLPLHNERLQISIIPSSPSLAGAEVELVNELAREMRLKHALEKLTSRYDYILIDCPPSLGLLTVNGLVAARDGVVIPVQCEYLALEGLGQLTQTIHRVRTALFPDLKVRGVVLTMFDPRTNLATDVVDEVNKHFPQQAFHSVIPRSIRLAEAPSYGLPISAYAPSSTGAKAYEALARELLQGDGVKI